MRSINRLRPTDIHNLEPGRHHDGGGLYLIVKPSKSKSWTYRYMCNGVQHSLGLGPASAISLREARRKAKELAAQVARGDNPAAKRKAEKAAKVAPVAAVTTFRDMVSRYVEAHGARWTSPKHTDEWPRSLDRHVMGRLGDMPILDIGTDTVVATLKPLWKRAPITGDRVRARIAAVMDMAIAAKLYRGDNPAAWEILQHLLTDPRRAKAVRHFASLPFAQIAAFMVRLRQDCSIAARCAELMILTACRPTMARLADWSEFNLDQATWTVPAHKMKNRQEFTIPLSRQLIEMLNSIPGGRTGYVFPGRGGGISERQLREVLDRSGAEDFTAHGFRSSFRTWTEETDAGEDVIAEISMAHVVGSAASRAYRRGQVLERRRMLMQSWANFVDGQDTDNVVPLRSVS